MRDRSAPTAKPFSTQGTTASTLSRLAASIASAVDADTDPDIGLGVLDAVDLVEHGDRSRVGCVLGAGGARRLRQISGKTACAEAPANHLRQVDPPRSVLERVGTAWPWNIDVGVQGEHGVVDGQGLRLHDVVHRDRLTDNRVRRKGQLQGALGSC